VKDVAMEQGVKVKRVECRIDGHVAWLLIDNAKRHNAMSMTMWHNLADGLERIDKDPDARVIVLAGADGRHFCAGGDISEFAQLRSGPEAMASYDALGKGVMARLRSIGKPTIAMIQGVCLGGGMALAANCDMRIAADNARLGVPAAKRGLSYDYAGLRLLVDLVGPAEAKRIMFTARQFPAAEASRIGLVSEIVPADALVEHVTALAAEIAANAPLSLSASKFIINMILEDEAQHDIAACTAMEAVCLASEDYAEATRSFLEKRSPVFKGR
jgi:enoyl-CoA hydratase/carnithine racemase